MSINLVPAAILQKKDNKLQKRPEVQVSSVGDETPIYSSMMREWSSVARFLASPARFEVEGWPYGGVIDKGEYV